VKVLVVDVGGNNIKILASGQPQARKVPSGPRLTARAMVASVKKAAEGWDYDAVTIGFPGPVKDGHPADEPKNIGRGWVSFDYARAFRKPVRIINDAVMQALGSYHRGRMLFLGLGTGLGAALVLDGLTHPLEIAHLPYRNGKTYEDFLGRRGLDRMGRKRWRAVVVEIVPRLHAAFQVDEVVLGGGNAKYVKDLPAGTRLGDNARAFVGGFRLWESAAKRRSAARKPRRPGRSRRVRLRASAA
jgi:polyphosphate glucokinase